MTTTSRALAEPIDPLDTGSRHRSPGSSPRWSPSWFEGSTFSSDWSSHVFDTWAELFDSRRTDALDVLEIGSWEGRSALFWLNFLPRCTLTCIDTFGGGAEHAGSAQWSGELPHVQARFRANTAAYADRLRLVVADSTAALTGLAEEGAGYDLVYVDGSHESQDVLADGSGSWALLRRGGWLVFDDYEWAGFADPARTPRPGVDAFLAAHEGEYDEVHRGWQVVIRRR